MMDDNREIIFRSDTENDLAKKLAKGGVKRAHEILDKCDDFVLLAVTEEEGRAMSEACSRVKTRNTIHFLILVLKFWAMLVGKKEE